MAAAKRGEQAPPAGRALHQSVDNPNAEVAIIVRVSIGGRSTNLGFDQIVPVLLASIGQLDTSDRATTERSML